jgi:hypothetical protein
MIPVSSSDSLDLTVMGDEESRGVELSLQSLAVNFAASTGESASNRANTA